MRGGEDMKSDYKGMTVASQTLYDCNQDTATRLWAQAHEKF